MEAVQSSIELLTTTYYDGHTVESLRGEIDTLLGQLNAVNGTLNLITLQEGDVEDLENSLEMVR